jgi:hypothetical protein
MEQLLLHLFGDYISQTEWMAKNKTQKLWIAFVHAVVYTIPFAIFLSPSWAALAVICITHAVIDHYRLVRYLIFFKNFLTDHSLRWEDCKGTGYHADMPVWLSVWLMVITDNTLHMVINYFALRYL